MTEKIEISLKHGDTISADGRNSARNIVLEMLALNPRSLKPQAKFQTNVKHGGNLRNFPRIEEKIEPIIEKLKTDEKLNDEIEAEKIILRNFDRVIMHTAVDQKRRKRNFKLRKF